jgi:hypothetical protein
MTIYEPGTDEDLLVVQWWNLLRENGDLELAFMREVWALAPFLANMGGDTVLTFEFDDNGIWFAAWYDPIMSGASCGLWVREDKRNMEAVEAGHTSMEIAFECFPVLVTTTRSPLVRETAMKQGFAELGVIPQLFNDEDSFVLYATKQSFEEARNG